jgi:hypothetical protein
MADVMANSPRTEIQSLSTPSVANRTLVFTILILNIAVADFQGLVYFLNTFVDFVFGND